MNWISIGSGNGLSPVHRQAITWTNAGLFSVGLMGTNFSEIQIEIQSFSFRKIHLKLRLPKWQPFCPGEMGQFQTGMVWNANPTIYLPVGALASAGTVLTTKFDLTFFQDYIDYQRFQTCFYWSDYMIQDDQWDLMKCYDISSVIISGMYRKISNLRCTNSGNLSDCCPVLQLPLANPLKPCVKLRMKM